MTMEHVRGTAGAEPPGMRPCSPLMLAFLLGSACVDEADVVSEPRTLSDDARVSVTVEMATDSEPDVCDLLADCDGACSVACDWEALVEYVPPGTCVAFICDLVDGRKVSFHACHPAT
jgi:hypothetical protein